MKKYLFIALCLIGCDKPPPQGEKPAVTMQGTKAVMTINSAKIPEKRVEGIIQPKTEQYLTDNKKPIIYQMKVGESAWVEPWTVWGDRDGIWMVNAFHNIVEQPHRDCVRITRVEDGFEVNLALSSYKWSRVDLPSRNYGWVGVPVTNLIMPE